MGRGLISGNTFDELGCFSQCRDSLNERLCQRIGWLSPVPFIDRPHMSPALSVAASLSPNIPQDIGMQVLSRSQPISDLADKHQVSRKFVYQQGSKTQQSLEESFAPSKGDADVLFHLSVTQNWLYKMILGLVLICHSSYRGVVDLFRDLFDTPISIGTVHNRLHLTVVLTRCAAARFASFLLSSNKPTISIIRRSWLGGERYVSFCHYCWRRLTFRRLNPVGLFWKPFNSWPLLRASRNPEWITHPNR